MVLQMEKQRPVTLEVDSLKFSVFSAEEIRKFSVCKVTSTVSFDSIGNPVTGGLYDVCKFRKFPVNSSELLYLQCLPAMGPSTRREVCSTCFNDQQDCIGHFGHIELIMPCYNPFFIKTICSIMRASCLKCSRLQVGGKFI